MTPAQKANAQARAKKAGRPYPNAVDNIAASRRKVRLKPNLHVHFVDNDLFVPSWQSVYQTTLMWEEIVRGVVI